MTWMQNLDLSLRLRRFLCILVVCASFTLADAQSEPESAPPPKPDTTEPIPLVETATQAEATLARLREMLTELPADRIVEVVEKQLPVLTREIDTRLSETRRIIAHKPSIETLRNLEADWRRIQGILADWKQNLTSRATLLDRQIHELDELGKVWDETLDAAEQEKAPPEVLSRIKEVITEIRRGRDDVENQQARTLTMQNRVAAQNARVEDALTLVRQAREDMFRRLFVRDTEPLWTPAMWSVAPDTLVEDGRRLFSAEIKALGIYITREPLQFFIHVMIFIALAAGLSSARRRLPTTAGEHAAELRSAVVFEMPVVSALVLSFLCSRWMYPEAPRLLWAILGAFALVPSSLIVRRSIRPDLHAGLYVLIAFYVFDQVRTITAALPLLPRLLFLAEMLAGMVLLVWLIKAIGRVPPSTVGVERWRSAVRLVAGLAVLVGAVASIANVLGYLTLSYLVGNALLSSAYLAIMLHAVIEILDNLVIIALHVRPLTMLSVVRRHSPLLRRRIRQVLQWLAVFLWMLFFLERLLLRERIFAGLREFLVAELAVGALRISLGDVLAFVVTVWASFVVSRFLRFLLEEDIFPRVHLRRGLPYAISTTLHYLILLVGFFVAVAALGVDMTRVTILAGAFSVGVGLGLQNIFNNFVSGLILLFERPVNIGDMVQVENVSGVVERIGIRASVIRTATGSEVIVPNGKLISERVINWTLSSRQHGIELQVAVPLGTDPGRVVEILERTAAANRLVSGDPPPKALVVKLGPDSIGIELRAWTERTEQWMEVRSELAIAISKALMEEKIPIR